jgi:hypothetical protein
VVSLLAELAVNQESAELLTAVKDKVAASQALVSNNLQLRLK